MPFQVSFGAACFLADVTAVRCGVTLAAVAFLVSHKPVTFGEIFPTVFTQMRREIDTNVNVRVLFLSFFFLAAPPNSNKVLAFMVSHSFLVQIFWPVIANVCRSLVFKRTLLACKAGFAFCPAVDT